MPLRTRMSVLILAVAAIPGVFLSAGPVASPARSGVAGPSQEQPAGLAVGQDLGPALLPLRDQARIYNDWLKTRLDTILPQVMREEDFDMWLVICRENNEDPVFFSLVPFTSMYASRTSMLVFFDKGAEGIERLTVSRSGIGQLYKSVWEPEKIDQWVRLAEIIAERNPKRIGINESDTFNYGDGLSAALKKKLMASLPAGFAPRVRSAERLAIRWLERRSPEQIEMYPAIVRVAHGIIAEAFSPKVVKPGVTATDDVVWWMRERSRELGVTNWFQPSVDIQRPKDSGFKDSRVIQRGDMLHCDFGIVYLKLCTDTQQLAYVLKEGETDAPKGLRDGLAQGNRLQDVHLAEMKTGRTGNEILLAALTRAKGEGLKPSIYTHPLGVYGHSAGPIIGLWDRQNGVPGLGDFPLFDDTVHSIELNVKAAVPEWNNQEVTFALEQDAVHRKTGPEFLDKRQTAFHRIRGADRRP